MTTEEKITKLETNRKAMAEEIERLKAKLVEKNEVVWIPEFGDSYMYIDPSGDTISTFSCGDNALDNHRIDFNNVYQSNNKTRKHLEWYRDNVLRVQNKLMQLHELLCPDFFPDWSTYEDKWTVYFDAENNYFTSVLWNYMNHFSVCFTEESVKKACKILNRDKFMMEDYNNATHI